MPLTKQQIYLKELESFEGAEIARISSIAFFALFVYEYLITFDQEVKYFWSGRWTATRFLFLVNRYLPPMIMLLGLMCFFVPHPTPQFCGPAIGTSFVANMAAIGIVQAVLVLRIWYLFEHSRFVRWGAIAAFLASIMSSLAFSFIAAQNLVLLPIIPGIIGCRAARPVDFWRMFFPSLLLHTLLYVLTAWKALKNRRILKDRPVLKKLLIDGGFFFLVVFVSVGFTGVGSFLTQYPKVNIPIIFSNYLISVTSIAVSRVLFSIHSLAANLGSDTAWLLNNAELNRVDWKMGEQEGEIIVESWSAEESVVGDEEWGTIGVNSATLKYSPTLTRSAPLAPVRAKNSPLNSPVGRTSPIKTTMVGLYNESNYY